MQTKTLTTAAATATIATQGGRQLLKAAGTWGGGTLTVTWCETESGTFVAIGSGVSLSANGCTGLETPPGFLQLALADSTGATISCVLDLTSKQP